MTQIIIFKGMMRQRGDKDRLKNKENKMKKSCRRGMQEWDQYFLILIYYQFKTILEYLC